MSKVKIAIAGQLRSGKSTVETLLVDEYGMVPFAFGDKLKDSFHREYPAVERDPKPRRGYQLYGQLMRYVYGEDIWINQMFSEIKRYRVAAEAYNITGSEIDFRPLVTDLRQANELEALRERGFVVIKLEAPASLRKERAEAAGDHFTDADLNFENEDLSGIEADYVVQNTGSLESLYEQVRKIMNNLV